MFQFDLMKTIQAAAVLLNEAPCNIMGIVRLIKLLYIADRESLKETGVPITGDLAVAMKHGPVLSNTYDLIKGEHIQAAEWMKFLVKRDYDVQLLTEPGRELLSRYEIRKLNEVSERYRDMDEWDIAEVTHGFPEWQKNDPGTSSKPIPIKDIIEAVGRLGDLDAMQRDAEARMSFDRAIGISR